MSEDNFMDRLTEAGFFDRLETPAEVSLSAELKAYKGTVTKEYLASLTQRHQMTLDEFEEFIEKRRKILKREIAHHKSEAAMLRSCSDGLGNAIGVVDRMKQMRHSPKMCVDQIERHFPSIFQTASPRRYEIPPDYVNPKQMATLLYWSIWDRSDWTRDARDFLKPDEQSVAVDQEGLNLLVLAKLSNYAVPTYFVSGGVLQSLINTDLPRDLVMHELPWPMPAMLFAIPKGMLLTPTGHITLMVVAKLDASEECRFQAGIQWDNPELNRWIATAYPTHADRETMAVLALASDGKTYLWECPLDSLTVQGGADIRVQGIDLTAEKEECAGLNPQEEQFASRNLPEAALQLLLGMLACPEMIEAGERTRGAREKKGKTKSELWSPNFFGRAYRKYELTGDPDENEEREKCHPRPHWRRGHFRHQRFGAGRAGIRIIWIRRVLINKPEQAVLP